MIDHNLVRGDENALGVNWLGRRREEKEPECECGSAQKTVMVTSAVAE